MRAFVLPGKTMELTNQQLKELNDDVQEFIDKLRIHYNDDTLAIAAALTQWGLRMYKCELSTPEFYQLLVYTIETNRDLSETKMWIVNYQEQINDQYPKQRVYIAESIVEPELTLKLKSQAIYQLNTQPTIEITITSITEQPQLPTEKST